ncbi:hypothetical protein SH601_03190 [Gracilibacillus sp. S3-1-1]|uniref:Uncharacterized protein n=1 Tax=Gracilibacillus pellucidus TaxID=3095368 RepID=A0ACC6M201_9BACI|nr:hypothetical protein [Gracilibacillus sp. S3-1-1]MDX8044980.1 hypothetical protein [Gracilibacillus sp. S3-1-1]
MKKVIGCLLFLFFFVPTGVFAYELDLNGVEFDEELLRNAHEQTVRYEEIIKHRSEFNEFSFDRNNFSHQETLSKSNLLQTSSINDDPNNAFLIELEQVYTDYITEQGQTK